MSGPRLSIIPAGAIFDRSLEPRDLQVLNLLGCHTDKAGWCRRSQVRMAQELDCSRSSVQRSLDRLCDAGWVQKKRPPWSAEDGQPSNSYMYRVILDRDDEPETSIRNPNDADSEAESHAPDAIAEGECPPVGTPTDEGGAHPDGHPGAQPYVGTGAHTYVGTKNDPLERPPIERERDARARAEKTARFLVDFEKRWPSKVDDRQRTAYAAEALSLEEQEAALAGIALFLDAMKRQKRDRVPAGWKYLEQKSWQLLAKDAPGPEAVKPVARNTPEAKALMVLHEIAGKSDAMWRIFIRGDLIHYPKPMTPRLAALAQAPDKAEWIILNRQQAGAWEALLRDAVAVANRQPLREGARAPWPWPPKVDGALYTATGPPPDQLMTDQDYQDFKS